MNQSLFEIAGGTVAGRDHIRVGGNSHDAYAWHHGQVTVAVVCDGCGSSEHSEVGAKLGAQIVVDKVLRHYFHEPETFMCGHRPELVLDRIKRSVLAEIQSIADAMGPRFGKNVSEYFLFTILGAILDQKSDNALIFGAGDGLYYLNNIPTVLTSQGNAPGYLSYNLVESNVPDPDLQIFWSGRLDKIQSLLLGTDGTQDLARAFDKPIPGKEELIGPISQFWEKDGFFKNPFSIGHRLALINRSISKIDWEKKALSETHGPLRDDTTLISIRRKKTWL